MNNNQIVVGTADCPIFIVSSIVKRSASITTNWSTLARRLDVTSEQIKRLRMNYHDQKISFEDLLVYVLETWVGKSGSKATLNNLIQVLEEHCEAIDVGELLRLEYHLACKVADCNQTIKWKDISPAFQDRVIETFHHFNPNLKFTEVLPKLTGSALVSFMRGKKPPVLFKGVSLPDKLSYYVNRKMLIPRNIISKKVFAQKSSDIYLFSGMNRGSLSKATGELTGHSTDLLLNSSNVKFVILDDENHFEEICKKTSEPVHLLRMERDGKLRWIKSNVTMKNLRNYIDQERDELDERELPNICGSRSLPVLICDIPGIGKSTLLAQVGHRLVQLYPNRTVLFGVLSEFIKLANSFKMENIFKVVELALQDLTGETPPNPMPTLDDKTVLLELLLDGYDEVDAGDRKVALEILQTIMKSFKNIRLWITSRPHLMDELEINLKTLGYKIQPFLEENQIDFLSSFWSREMQLDQMKLKLFAKSCLSSLKAKMNLAENDIAGIPLQCLLIGEVYEDQAVKYAKNFKENLSMDEFKNEVGTITNLYFKLVHKKFEKYKSAYGKPKLSEDDLRIVHFHMSLQELFPFHKEILKLTNNMVSKIDIDDVMKVGILTSTSMGGVMFLQRTLAEYFVASFILDKLQQEEEWTAALIDFAFRLVGNGFCLEEVQTQTICYFLNLMIANLKTEILPNNFPSELNDEQLGLLKNIAFACIEGNFVQIFKLFEARGTFDKLCGNFFNLKLLLLSVSSSEELVKSILTHFERYHDFDVEAQKASLREAVKNGKFSTLEFLIKQKKLKGLVENWDENPNLVCDCVKNTKGSSEVNISERIMVLENLVGIKGSLANSLNSYSTTSPLLSKDVHAKLLIKLVQLGENVFVPNKDGDTILHFNYFNNVFPISREDYHNVMTSISNDNLKKLIQEEHAKHDTALMTILRRFDPLPQTLDKFHDVDADFNYVNEEGISVLGVAIKNGRSAETIRKLIQLGIDVRGVDKEGNTPLHAVAQFPSIDFSSCDRYTIIQYLIEKGSDPNALNNLKESPFQLFLSNKDGEFETFRLFRSIWDERSLWTPTMATLALGYAVGGDDAFPDHDFEALAKKCDNHGADFNGRDDEGNSLLHLAANNGKARTVKFLCKKGMEVNSKNNLGQSPLHMAASSNNNTCLEVIIYLIENGANPMKVTADGKNIFHFAALWPPDALEYLSKLRGVNVNGKDADGNSPLHCAVNRRNKSSGMDCVEECKLLIQYGADANVLDCDGYTPLRVAMAQKEKDELLIKLLSQSSLWFGKTIMLRL